jgi:hypothetical protein
MREHSDQGTTDERNTNKRGPEAMNTPSRGPWKFRWGNKVLLKPLGRNMCGTSMIPSRLFRRFPILGPVLAWIIGIAVHDLRQPQSRIKALVQRVLEKRKEPQRVRALVVGQQTIEGPAGQKLTEKTGEHQEVPEE